jgi:pyruvate-formate lyase-activating enzyme
VVKQAGGFASINLLTLPGVTDRPEEVEALFRLVEETRLDLIQWRNLNLDPEAYLAELGLDPPEQSMGIAQLIAELKRRFPRLRHGYFNPMVTERKPKRTRN